MRRAVAEGVPSGALYEGSVNPPWAGENRALWYYTESGSGRPLILLHGIGMSHQVWCAVMPYLSATRRVIAFDTAGFGLTPPLPEGTPPTISNLVDGLARSIREIGITVPVDIAGNSLGGYMALEAGRRGMARSVVAISPAGLWRERPPPHVKYVFGGLRLMATRLPGLMKAAVRPPWLRELALAVPISVGSRRMRAADALRMVDDLAESSAFEATFDHTKSPFSGRDIAVPVTVAFGDRDGILPKCSRHRKGLPAHTRWLERPGWGHVPMWVDPAGVSQLILEGTRGDLNVPGSSLGCDAMAGILEST
jgi:pimeloyl-ACP methyl ester carboxylesterase